MKTQSQEHQQLEGVVTLGMRGPGDVKLPADTGTELVNKILTDQRAIIQEVTGLQPAKVPQVWTLYKEVQDTTLLPNLWEQLNLSSSYGVDRLWMFNVGDMKNEELPLQLAMDYAWNPKALPIEALPEWERRWAGQQLLRASRELSDHGRLSVGSLR